MRQSSSIDIDASAGVSTYFEPDLTPEGEAEPSRELIATILHELKTPLTSLLGYARMLRIGSNRMTPERREECFGVMERQGRKIMRMLEDMLQSSRLSEGPPALRRAPLDLGKILEAAVATAEGLSQGHRFSLDVPARDLGVYGDQTAIEHIVTNLLENAVKYSPVGSSISVSVGEQGSDVIVGISDQGRGIAEEDLPFIFERYRQAGVEAVGGVGLGLSIVAGLVAAHGGRIWVASEEGAGTTFSFTLPRRAAR